MSGSSRSLTEFSLTGLFYYQANAWTTLYLDMKPPLTKQGCSYKLAIYSITKKSSDIKLRTVFCLTLH